MYNLNKNYPHNVYFRFVSFRSFVDSLRDVLVFEAADPTLTIYIYLYFEKNHIKHEKALLIHILRLEGNWNQY